MQPRWRRAFGHPTHWGLALAVGLAMAATRCGGGAGVGPAPVDPGAVSSSPGVTATTTGEAAATPGIAVDSEHTVGPPYILDNLAVFPVYARVMEDIGDYLPLDDALEKGVAVVREMGAEAHDEAELPAPQEQQPQQQQGNGNGNGRARRGYHGDGAQVNTLVIENRSDQPILVLAGTVVKGGKQDRQIGQDFIIGKKQTVPVDAFCVEHGRWNAVRNGVATEGSFKTLKTLAAGDVRAAGQYEQNQSQVWSKVGQINRATGKETASDTLTASLEDDGAAAERGRAAAKVQAFLASVPMSERTVGLAYAVGGEVTGARWFIHHKLFARYSETLVNTAVIESFTQRAVAKAQGQPLAPGACAPEKVAAFVSGADRGRHEERKTAGENTNAYEFSDDVYAAEAQVKMASPSSASSPSAAAAPPAKSKAVTKDFLKRKK